MASALLASLYISAMTVYTLGIYRTYYFKKRFISQADYNTGSTQDNYLNMLASYQLWGNILLEMKATWRTTRDICILLMPYVVRLHDPLTQIDAGGDRLSIAILQINLVSGTIFARTSAISAFMFATMGLVLSHIYTSKKLDLNDRRIIDKWVKTSLSIDRAESVEFWVCLILPISCTIWSRALATQQDP
ncbi:hypothetical protein CVT25_009688 [Psilocybe cyanescens]|uniref:Uncharacterized protein n=1 Tax=Psilocybe cyanescens TaxID=93625 RepID=A0A409XDB3_PSICY|nr:hypothetical protein CVT25_009688 [Psilocybe cyanescens]